MARFKKYKLSELVEIVGGGTPKTTIPEYWNGDIPWLSVVDFGNDNKKVYKTEKSITAEGLKNSSTKILKTGQLIISARGTVGELAMLGKDMAFNQSCYGLNGIEGLITNNFLYYLLKNELHSIKSVTHGSVFDTITRQTFEQIEVEIPEDLPTQTRIASILSSLDDKIELNRRANHTLEQIAQTLFKKYFVDDIEPENLPEGWRWGRLDEIISVKHGYAFEGKYFTEDATENILLTPGNFKIGGGFNYNKFKYYAGEIPNDYILQKNDLIVTMTDLSKDGDTLGYSALTPVINGKKILHNQRIGKVIFKESEKLKYFLFWVMRSEEYRSFVLGSATGTTVKHTSPTRICEYACPIPPDNKLSDFNKIIVGLVEKELINQNEIEALSKVRDSLLPKLMSGEIEVNTAEKELVN